MRYGYFDDARFEYVIERPDTPRSWTNYLGSKTFGSVISNNAGGYSFIHTAALGRFTRLPFNSVPMDQPGKYFYIRDNESNDYWSSSWQPVGKPLDVYTSECRFGTGYARITSAYANIRSESTYVIPLGQQFEYWRIKLTNTGKAPRKLSLFTFCEFASEWNIFQDHFNVQYSAYCAQSRFEDGYVVSTSLENNPEDPAHFKNGDQGRWAWMKLLGAEVAGYDLNREKFIGLYHSYHNPRAVVTGECLGSTAYGDNACGGMKANLDLAPGETREIIVMLGVGRVARDAKKVVAELGTSAALERELQKVKDYWHDLLKVVQVRTPDEDFDHMANVWGAYDALINFYWCRSASLIYSGDHRDGFGYRDTIQDLMGSMHAIPDQVRERLEFMITGQESNGGAMPELKPYAHTPGNMPLTPADQQRSDDCIWLFAAIKEYINETGDWDFLNKVLPYSDQGEATVFGHLKRALEFNLERSGKHGLPCGLYADWDDGFRLGFHGETVMLAFQIRQAYGIYAEMAGELGRPEEASWSLGQRDQLDANLQKHCWDGEWFIRAFREKGDKLGAKECKEGWIFRPPQCWSVISGAATDEQARTALNSVDKHLFTEYGLMALQPPYYHADSKEIRAMVLNPGQKENAGIFNHSQGWTIMANTMIGEGDRAYRYLKAFLPSRFNDSAEVRKIEPYVHGQSTDSIFSKEPGQGHLPWLTGSASWTHFTMLQYILGLRPERTGLRVDPCIPSTWPGFTAVRRFRGKTISIEVKNPNAKNKCVTRTTLNGEVLEGNLIPEEKLLAENLVVCELG